MIRIIEVAVFFAPALAFLLWRVAIARGLDGPPPRQIALIFVGLLAMGAGLAWYAAEDRLGPGLYVPAELVDGRIVQGHSR